MSYLRQKCKHGVFVSEDSDELIVLMYADDISSFADTVLHLQRQIDKICSFCKCVKMKINRRKTKIVVFRNWGCLKKCEKWTYDGNLIEVVSFYKYLGIYMTPKLSWSKTWENATSQAQKAIACIFRYQKTFGLFAPQDIFKLFDSIVCPILTYGVEVWGYQYVNKLEKVQSKFCKQYLSLSQNAADFYALGECGRYPLYVVHFVKCIKYWLKLIALADARYPKQCYMMLYRLDAAGRNTWDSHVRKLSFKYGFGYAWFSQELEILKIL